MRILYLIHQFYPMHYTGTERVTLNIASMMRKIGHNVKVITYSFYDTSFYDSNDGEILTRQISYNGIDVIALRHHIIPTDLDYTLGDNKMTEIAESLIRKEKPDIIHVCHTMRISELLISAIRLGIPYMFTLTDFWLICPKYTLINSKGDLCAGPDNCKTCISQCPELSPELLRSRLSQSKQLLEGAASIVAPSGFLAGIFNNEMPCLDIKVIEHGLRHSLLRKNQRHYQKDDTITMGYCGSLNHHKGVHVAIQAVRQIKSNRLRFVIFGSGDNAYTARLGALVNGDTRIEFCGVFADSQAAEVFSMLDIIVVPSLWFETYVLTIREAFLCSIPVIASNIGVMSEVIKDGINGFTFRIGDPDDLRKVIEHILSDTSCLNTMKNAIGQHYIPTIEQEAYEYKRIYSSMQSYREKMK